MEFQFFNLIENVFESTIETVYFLIISLKTLFVKRPVRFSIKMKKRRVEYSLKVAGPYTMLFFAFAVPTYFYITLIDYHFDFKFPLEALRGDDYIPLLFSVFAPPIVFDATNRIQYYFKGSDSRSEQKRKNGYFLLSPIIFLFLSLYYTYISIFDPKYDIYWTDLGGIIALSVGFYLVVLRRVRDVQFGIVSTKKSIRDQWRVDCRTPQLKAVIMGVAIGFSAWLGPVAYIKVWQYMAADMIKIRANYCKYDNGKLLIHTFVENNSSNNLFIIPDNIQIAVGDFGEDFLLLKNNNWRIFHKINIDNPNIDDVLFMETGKLMQIHGSFQLSTDQQKKFGAWGPRQCVFSISAHGLRITKESYIQRVSRVITGKTG